MADEFPDFMTPPQSTLGLIRLGYLGRDPAALMDLSVRYISNSNQFTLATGTGGYPQDVESIKRRIFRDFSNQDAWKGQDVFMALLRFPANYPLTYICRRLRKLNWKVVKEVDKSPELSIAESDYTDVRSDFNVQGWWRSS